MTEYICKFKSGCNKTYTLKAFVKSDGSKIYRLSMSSPGIEWTISEGTKSDLIGTRNALEIAINSVDSLASTIDCGWEPK